MTSGDPELTLFRERVSCAALLERHPNGYRLDARDSTRKSLKYRRGEGEIIILLAHGRGWFDPTGPGRGDVISLAQHVDPHLTLGHVRKILRPIIGIEPTLPDLVRGRKSRAVGGADVPPGERWATKPRLRAGSAAWRYLTGSRCLPTTVLDAAVAADVVREGSFDCAWFAHRDEAGSVRHVEFRSEAERGSLRGGAKSLFHLPGGAGSVRRVVVTEAPIDALSVAAVEGIRPDTAYVATGGGMGPASVAALQRLLAGMTSEWAAVLAIATDNDAAGERYADRHAELAAAAGVRSERLRPTIGNDWNDIIRQGRGI